MDLRESAAEAEFRRSLRAWLAAHLPAEQSSAWDRLLHDAGYTGLTWPATYGGRGLPFAFEAIFREESAAAGAPEHRGLIGLGMVGPTLIAHGSPAQRQRYLPGILSGDIVFCQGFSETEAGSDLAAVRTLAEPDGDGYRVNGHKVWSSYAHLATHCLLLARGEAGSTGHRGLHCLLVEMSAPGVEVAPIRQLTGAAQFNEVRLTDVRVPADALVGAPGDGWRVAMTTLSHERGVLGFTLTGRLDALLRDLLRLARQSGRADDPVLRDRIAASHVDLQALRYSTYRAADELRDGGAPGPQTAIAKLHWAHANQRLTALAGDLANPDDQHWSYERLRSRGNSIEGGTSEVLRSVLAERVLQLPRSR